LNKLQILARKSKHAAEYQVINSRFLRTNNYIIYNRTHEIIYFENFFENDELDLITGDSFALGCSNLLGNTAQTLGSGNILVSCVALLIVPD
jgi:hypothetical protein